MIDRKLPFDSVYRSPSSSSSLKILCHPSAEVELIDKGSEIGCEKVVENIVDFRKSPAVDRTDYVDRKLHEIVYKEKQIVIVRDKKRS